VLQSKSSPARRSVRPLSPKVVTVWPVRASMAVRKPPLIVSRRPSERSLLSQ
jgi:hypothetical protein